MLVDEREAGEGAVDDGHVEVVAAARAVDHVDLLGCGERRVEEPFEPRAHLAPTIAPGIMATMARQMRRLLVGVTLAAALASLAGASTSSAFNGVQAKMWAGRLAALGQRPAGRMHEKQAGAIVRDRLNELGYDVTTQTFPLPEGTRSLNVVGRTPGPIRVIIVAHM